MRVRWFVLLKSADLISRFYIEGINLDIQTRVLMEGNLANEVGLVVLDTIELFCGHFKVSAL